VLKGGGRGGGIRYRDGRGRKDKALQIVALSALQIFVVFWPRVVHLPDLIRINLVTLKLFDEGIVDIGHVLITD